ncbi:plexin-A4-like [Lytechinus pictus]|uniref:plexin-A4-like n=1 Tax=Lytechinus pictus TaxID=7653 RepID=UPI0030BA2467
MTNSVLGVLLIQMMISCQIGSIQSAPLSSYLVSSFTSPDTDSKLPFNHIAINNITGDIYIGARERLYQLDSELTLKETVDTGSCPLLNNNRFVNDNKLIVPVVIPQNYKLITCGGCKNDCQVRNLANISLDLFNLGNTDEVAAKGDQPSVGVVALDADFDSRGVGKADGLFYLFIARSGGGPGSGFTFISKNSLVDIKSQQNIPANILTDDSTRSKHIISYKNFIYVFISRHEKTYLGRLCRNSLDEDFESYTEIELQCTRGGSQNIIQSAYIGPAGSQLAESMNINTTDDLLYAVFSSSPSSSLCVYKMIDVQQSFEDAILGCILGTETGIANSFMSGSKCEELDLRT